MTETQAETDKLDQSLPIGFIPVLLLYLLVVFSLLEFLPAGDWAWLEGWITAVSLPLAMTMGMTILNQHNPRVVRNRMRLKKEGLTQDTEKPASFDRFFSSLAAVGFLVRSSFPHWGIGSAPTASPSGQLFKLGMIS